MERNEAPVLTRGSQNPTGKCLQCGRPGRQSSGTRGVRGWFCERHWHGRKWESARRCTAGPDGGPCPRCKVAYRDFRREQRAAAGVRAMADAATRKRVVGIARREGLAAAAAASGGWGKEAVRHWCHAAGVQWKVIKRPKRHGIQHGNCPCDICVEARHDHAQRNKARMIRLCQAGKMPAHIHGTESGYQNWQCRCEPCKRAGAAAQRASIERAHARREAGQMPAKYHGTPTGYSYFGCRCRRCTTAASQRRVEHPRVR